MGAYRVVYTPSARRDLKQIVKYIARDDPQAAERFGLELFNEAESLSWPLISGSGGHLPERPGVRKLIHGQYLILYRIMADENEVRVLRFWHGAQDRNRLGSL